MTNQPMMDFDESWLSAYLDQELTEEQSRYVEELLQSRSDLQKSLDDLIRVRTAIANCRLELPGDTRIVRNGPWDAPKSVPPPSGGRAMQYPTWLLSLAAMILVLATLSSFFWLTPGGRDGGMIATTMEPKSKMQSTEMQNAPIADGANLRTQEPEATQDAAIASSSSNLESDFSAPPATRGAPSSMNAPSAASSLRSDPVEVASELAFRSEQLPVQPKSSQRDLLAHFIQVDDLAKDADDTKLEKTRSDISRSEQKDTPYSLAPAAPRDFLWDDEVANPRRSRSVPSEQETAIVWFRSKVQAAEKELSADKKTAVPAAPLSADATPATPSPSLKSSSPPRGLEIRIPAELWSLAMGGLQAKGFEIPEDLPPGDYRFEAIENVGNAEKPWTFRKLGQVSATEEERTQAYFSLIVIPAKPTTKSGSSE